MSSEPETTVDELAEVIDGAFLVSFSSLSNEPPRTIATYLIKPYRITPRNETT